jgi:hypothetical protein
MNLSGASVLLGLVVVASTDWRVAAGMAVIGVGIWWWMRH